VANGDQPTPLLMIAGQVVHPYLASRLVAGYVNAVIDQNGSAFKVFDPPPAASSPTTTLEPARIVRNR
jgi:hypothetical protein